MGQKWPKSILVNFPQTPKIGAMGWGFLKSCADTRSRQLPEIRQNWGNGLGFKVNPAISL